MSYANGSIVEAYRRLECASLKLQKAVMAGDGPGVTDAVRHLSECRDALVEFCSHAQPNPEEAGSIKGLASRIRRINEVNSLLIRRRLMHIRQLKKDLFGRSDEVGYDASAQSVIGLRNRDIIDELA